VNIITQSLTDLDDIKFFMSKNNTQKSTGLPQIDSPFLKKTVFNLFAQNKSSSLAPIKRSYLEKEKNFDN